MPRRQTTVERYEVLNPRRIPSGIHVLRYETASGKDVRFYEGEHVLARDVPEDIVAAWVAGGFLREGKRG